MWTILKALVEIPIFLKNILDLCGFGNPLSLMSCTDDDIAEIEKFMREEWVSIMKKKGPLSNDQLINYFGEFFSKNPSEFEFMPGEKKLIKALASHIDQIISTENEIEEGLKKFMKNTQSIGPESNEPEEAILAANQTEGVRRNHYFLSKLNSAATRNKNRKPGGYRYDSDIKSFSTYLRLLAGPFVYDTIQRNLECCLPSLSSVNHYIQSSSCHIAEGVLRVDELLVYLIERKLPHSVSLSEDATRIVGRVQYDRKTNQVVGFTLPINTANGMPIPFTYPARNANEILKHFSVDNSESTFLNVVMAQPLAEVPPFCLLVYGSDNKYTSSDVSNRWDFMLKELASRNINVISISTDSDPRYNAAMRHKSKLGQKSDVIDADWFASGAITWPFFIQDPTHIATKLRNFILRTTWNKRSLPFGRQNFIRLKYLYYLLDNFTKDKHELTASILNPVDKQNFQSVMKMCSEKVTNLLKLCVKNSLATVIFLETIRDITDAFMDKSLMPLERIRKVWYRVFILRLWRRYVTAHRNYSLQDNFLTSNCYSCIELNAHSLLQLIAYLRSINRPEWFLPHLFGSQQCESTFRQLRSLTSTFSTVANCSTKEALARFNKIQMINETTHMTSTKFEYPRLEPAKNKTNTFELPTFHEIMQEIENCSADAIDTALELNLITEDDIHEDFELLSCRIKPCSLKPNVKAPPKSSLTPKIPKLSNFDGITLKNFAATKNCVDENGPFVEIFFDNNAKRIVVKKTSFCWLLRRDWKPVSADRLRRVQHSQKTKLNQLRKRTITRDLKRDTNKRTKCKIK